MKHLSDETLSAFKVGCPIAFRDIFNEYYQEVLNFAKKLTNDLVVAEDITMYAFEKLHQLHDKFETLINIRAFLFVTARNALYDHWRNQKREKMHNARLHKATEYERVSLPYDWSDYRMEVLELIYSMMERLPDQQKRIFKLIYIDGYSTDEVAEMLNIATSTVRTQKSRAVNWLKQIIEKGPKGLACLLLFIEGNRS